MKVWQFIIALLFLISCTPAQSRSIDFTYSQSVGAIEKVYTPVNKSPHPYQRDYSSYYQHPNFKISTYGVDSQRIINILSSINPIFFNDISEIKFVYSNKDELMKSGTHDKNGFYVYDSKSIEIYAFDEGDEYIRSIIIHELTHHYCWNIKNEKTDNHPGCFLTAPIP